MALRGSKPSAVPKRLKCLFYGPAGVGKTTAAIQFPRPYLIDTERGAENPQYVTAIERTGGVVLWMVWTALAAIGVGLLMAYWGVI